jgi:integrase
VSDAAVVSAMPLLKKYQLIGKSRPRDRRPTQAELDTLLAYFDTQAGHKQAKIPMRAIVEFSLLSARRISETCRLRWGDVNGADMTCIVRDMKDPKVKKGNHHEFPLLGRAWDIVMAQPRVNPENPDERIFPYNSKSCGAAYTRAKNALGIKNLRLHDNRREAASRFIEGHESFGGKEHSIPQAMVLTGHKNPNVLTRTYMKLNAKDLHPKKSPAGDVPSSSPSSPAGDVVPAEAER